MFRPYVNWLLGISFVFLQFFLQLSIGVLLPTLEKAFDLNPLQAGELAASYYLTYMLLQLPVGALLDIYGTRVLLSFGALCCGLGCWLLSLSETLALAIAARVLMGFGAAFAFVGAVQIIFENFPPGKHSLMVGITESFAMVTAILSNTYFAGLLSVYSWRHIFIFAGFFSIGISVLQWLILPVASSYSAGVGRRFINSCIGMLKSRFLWLNGLYCGLLFSLVSSFCGLWAMPFLLSVQKNSLPEVAFEASMLFLGIAFGSPVAGLLYKCVNVKKILLISAFLSFILVSWLVWWTPVHSFYGIFGFLLLGFVCCGYVVSYPLACDSVPPLERGAALGFTNMLCVITSPLLQVAIGYIVKYSSSLHFGPKFVSDYRWGLSLLPVAMLLAFVIIMFLPERSKLEKFVL